MIQHQSLTCGAYLGKFLSQLASCVFCYALKDNENNDESNKSYTDFIVVPKTVAGSHCFRHTKAPFSVKGNPNKEVKGIQTKTWLCPSPLTFFQSPFDRAWLLAYSVKVSVQGGHKEQAFRKRNCAGTAKPLQRHKDMYKSGWCTLKQSLLLFMMHTN